ncbi:MAG: SRPBCC domain-containing protein [Rhodospirillaceae bacterium]|nr:SRPBCC domain-containing protein [Rhodospirillaceae bacterium]
MALAAPAANDDRVLRLEREFKAPPERVFAAFTDPRLLAQWFGPEGMACPVCEVDLRVGGGYRACMRGDAGEHWVSGTYRAIEPPRRLAFTWAWEENGRRGHETLVEIDFAPAGRNTRLVLTHRGFETGDSRDNHRVGWTSSFVCLDLFLEGE